MIQYVYGVRVYAVNPEYILVKQTVKKTGDKRYIIDHNPDGSQKERHIAINDDRAIADAVRHALTGKL